MAKIGRVKMVMTRSRRCVGGKSRPGVTSVRSRRIIDPPAAGRKQQGPRVGLRTDRELLTRYSALGGVPGGSPNLRPLQAESWQARLLPSGSARSWFPVSRFAMNQSAGPRHTLPPGMAAVLYRCATTGQNVQVWFADDVPDDSVYISLRCPACARVRVEAGLSGRTKLPRGPWAV